MKIREIKKEAKASLKGRWGFAVLLTIVTYLIYSGLSFPFEVMVSGGFEEWVNTDNVYASIISNIFLVLLAPLIMANYWIFLGMVRQEEVHIKDLFKPFLNFGLYVRSLAVYILMTIYTLLWFLLLIVPGIIKGIAYSQSYYILKDNPDYSANQIITESRKLMNGHKWSYFLLLLSFIGWAILSVLTLGLGFLWLIPYATTSLAKFYEHLLQNQQEV
ncbi:DUF975 family protein [Priestia megaterium]|nr:DUF975 family protein [Priestia megaterium]